MIAQIVTELANEMNDVAPDNGQGIFLIFGSWLCHNVAWSAGIVTGFRSRLNSPRVSESTVLINTAFQRGDLQHEMDIAASVGFLEVCNKLLKQLIAQSLPLHLGKAGC